MLALLAGCGGAARQRRPTSTVPVAAPHGSLAFGLTEGNAQLLSGAVAASRADPSKLVSAARRALEGLRPRYLRLLVDWAALQPDASHPPALEEGVSGCARSVAPCAQFDGVRDELAAIASRQRAGGGAGSPQVLVDILGAPAWATAPPHGCEFAQAAPSAMTIRPSALPAYRALIAGLLSLARREGVQLTYWSPWNEPNDPRFLTPQRSACSSGSPSLAPAAYAQLAQAMQAALAEAGGEHELVLGELGGYLDGSAHRTSIGQFVDGLPATVLCASDLWSVHAYSRWGPRGSGPDPARALERALDMRRSECRAGSPRIWVTEAGAGAPDPGHPRGGSAGEERRGCLALAASIERWAGDPSVAAVFQYTFRDDPAFPVGLESADLTRLHPAYSLWLRFAGGAPPAALASACQ